MTQIADIERIKLLASSLLKEEKAIARLKGSQPDFSASDARLRSHSDKLNGCCEQRRKLQHELHVACVDAGIADYRTDEEYADCEVHHQSAFASTALYAKPKPRQFPIKGARQ